jgi:hypothetical protein
VRLGLAGGAGFAAVAGLAVAGLALSALLAGCGTDVRGTRLQLATVGPQASAPADCRASRAAPLRVERDGDAMVFVDVASGERRAVVWPEGFAAWAEYGRAVLYARDGSIVGREGDVLDKIGGAATADGGFRVCAVGVRTYL